MYGGGKQFNQNDFGGSLDDENKQNQQQQELQN